MAAERVSARKLVDRLVVDATPLAGPIDSDDPLGWPGYRDKLEEARAETGVDEALLVVRGRLAEGGTEAVLAAWEFGFLGGSMGTVVGERLALAYEAATRERLPVVLLPSTGGSRMQEGMASLVQMAKTTVAARRHAEAGLLQVAVLRDPTTGGVFASHVNLADVVLAQPGATIGFAGPRVAEAMTDGPLPEGSHTAEGARAAGLVDEVVPLDALPEVLGRVLAWPGAAAPRPVSAPGGQAGEPEGAWEEFQRARDPARPTADAYLDRIEVAAELRGDRSGDDDPTIRVALARVHGRPIVLVAIDRTRAKGRVTPGGYRKAWRGLRLADRMGVPVVTLVDTPGADASAASEAGGVAHHISATFAELLAVRSPVVAVTIGEGGSGGALALSVGDRLLIQEHAVFSVIAPEGAAAILHRDASRGPEVAELLKPTARELERLGIADEVVAEPPGGEIDTVLAAVCRNLDELAEVAPEQRLASRLDRWRRVARPSDTPEAAATGAVP